MSFSKQPVSFKSPIVTIRVLQLHLDRYSFRQVHSAKKIRGRSYSDDIIGFSIVHSHQICGVIIYVYNEVEVTLDTDEMPKIQLRTH